MTLFATARDLVRAIEAHARMATGHDRAALEVAAWFVRVGMRHLESFYRARAN